MPQKLDTRDLLKSNREAWDRTVVGPDALQSRMDELKRLPAETGLELEAFLTFKRERWAAADGRRFFTVFCLCGTFDALSCSLPC